MHGPPAPGIRAVLFTDMVGSTQLRSSLGEARADALRRDHDELLGAIVSGLTARSCAGPAMA